MTDENYLRRHGPQRSRGEIIAGRIVAPIMLSAAIMADPVLLWFGLGSGLLSMVLVPAIFFTLALAALYAAWFLSKKYIRSEDYRVCPKCRYSLRNMPDSGACPECGTQYKISELQRIWDNVPPCS